MPTLQESFNYGSSLRNQNPELTRQLSEAFTTIVQAVNFKVSKYVTDDIQNPNVDPPASSTFNQNFDIGDVYIRTDTDSAWMMTSRTTDIAVTWTKIT